MRIDHRTEIKAPIERVWQLTTDVEAWPELTPTVRAVRRLDAGELRPTSRAEIDQPGQPTRVWTVSEVDAPRRFVWSTPVRSMTMTATHELTPTAQGTSNHLVIDITGRGSGLVGRLLRRRMLKVLATENAGFTRAAEQQPAGSS